MGLQEGPGHQHCCHPALVLRDFQAHGNVVRAPDPEAQMKHQKLHGRVGSGWKSVKLSHEISSLPPGSVWTGNTMRITFLLAFQQFCFRAWAKQGSAEAWEPRGDTNTWERGMNGSKSLHATHCLHHRGSPAS